LTAATCNADSCDASAAPTNGNEGNCTSSLASGSVCQPTCNSGHTVSGTSSCSLGSLTAATCNADQFWSQTVFTTVCTTTEFNNPENLCKSVMMQAYCTSMDICSGTPPAYVTGVSLSASAARRNTQITFIIAVSNSATVTAAAILPTAASLTPAKLAAAVNAASLAITGSSYNTRAADYTVGTMSQGVAAGLVRPQDSSSDGWIVICVASTVGGVLLLLTIAYVLWYSNHRADQFYYVERETEKDSRDGAPHRAMATRAPPSQHCPSRYPPLQHAHPSSRPDESFTPPARLTPERACC